VHAKPATYQRILGTKAGFGGRTMRRTAFLANSPAILRKTLLFAAAHCLGCPDLGNQERIVQPFRS